VVVVQEVRFVTDLVQPIALTLLGTTPHVINLLALEGISFVPVVVVQVETVAMVLVLQLQTQRQIMAVVGLAVVDMTQKMVLMDLQAS
jgi:hypothetical protein